jgi:hypothetical protein
MKKFNIFYFVVLFSVLSLAGCDKPDTPETQEPQDPNLIWLDTGSEEYLCVLNDHVPTRKIKIVSEHAGCYVVCPERISVYRKDEIGQIEIDYPDGLFNFTVNNDSEIVIEAGELFETTYEAAVGKFCVKDQKGATGVFSLFYGHWDFGPI